MNELRMNGRRVLVLRPGAEAPEILTLPDDTPHIDCAGQALHAAVGGWLESVGRGASIESSARTIRLLVNEDGLRLGLAPCVYVEALRTVLVGPVVVCVNDAEGETVGLTDAEIAQVEMLRRPDFPYPVLRLASGRG